MTPSEFPIFILTLEGDEARRAPLLAALGAAGLGHELLLGIDGRAGLPAELEARIDRNAAEDRMRRPMTDGEFACALSHQAAYQAILDRNLPGAVILEDDAVVLPGFAQFMADRAYGKADMVMLDHQSGWFSRRDRVAILPGVEGYRPLIQPWLATGYSMSAKAAAYMADRSFPISAAADWPVDIVPLQPLAVYPRLIHNNNDKGGVSHLSNEREKMEDTRPKSNARFLTGAYWRTKYFKKTAKRLY